MAAHKVMRDIMDETGKAGRLPNSDEEIKFNAARDDLNAIKADIDRREALDKESDWLAAAATRDGLPSGDHTPLDVPGTRKGTSDPEKAQRDAVYAEAFDKMLHRGYAGVGEKFKDLLDGGRSTVTGREFRDLDTTDSGSAAGYLIPPGFLARIVERQKWYSAIATLADSIDTPSGQSLVFPSNDDVSNKMVPIAQNTAVSEVDLSFGQKTLGAGLWTTGSVKVSRALMQDSFTDLDAFISKKFGQRVGRGANYAYTTGAGISAGLNTVTPGLTLTNATINFTQLLAAKHSIDPAYRQNAVWMFSDAALQEIEGLVDANNRPLFQPAGSFGNYSVGSAPRNFPGASPGGTDMLLGHPIVINNDLGSVSAHGGAQWGIFGDFEAGFLIRTVSNSTALLRLEERYAEAGEIGFILFTRMDATVTDQYALAGLVNAA